MTEENLMSDFNSNKASLIRVDKLMGYCHVSNFEGDYLSLFKHLSNLRIEARYKMNSKSKEGEKIREECDKQYKKLKQNYDVFFKNQNHPIILNNFKNQLDTFFLFLTDFMGDKGMLLTDKDRDEGL